MYVGWPNYSFSGRCPHCGRCAHCGGFNSGQYNGGYSQANMGGNAIGAGYQGLGSQQQNAANAAPNPYAGLASGGACCGSGGL